MCIFLLQNCTLCDIWCIMGFVRWMYSVICYGNNMSVVKNFLMFWLKYWNVAKMIQILTIYFWSSHRLALMLLVRFFVPQWHKYVSQLKSSFLFGKLLGRGLYFLLPSPLRPLADLAGNCNFDTHHWDCYLACYLWMYQMNLVGHRCWFKFTLVLVMGWCYWATSHYLKWCFMP